MSTQQIGSCQIHGQRGRSRASSPAAVLGTRTYRAAAAAPSSDPSSIRSRPSIIFADGGARLHVVGDDARL